MNQDKVRHLWREVTRALEESARDYDAANAGAEHYKTTYIQVSHWRADFEAAMAQTNLECATYWKERARKAETQLLQPTPKCNKAVQAEQAEPST